MKLTEVVLIAIAVSGAIHAQEPKFEVASVKALPPGSRFAPMTQDATRFTAPSTNLWVLVARAYGVDADQVMAPDWLNTSMYSVAANIPDGATKEQFSLMLQNLLAERFRLTVHRETKVIDGYELVVGKGGSKLKEAEPGPGGGGGQFGPDGAHLTYTKSTMSSFAGSLPMRFRQISGGDSAAIRVADKTGLAGVYDFTLNYDLPGREGQGVDIFGAIESQLGLKLQAAKLKVDFVVVDHAEKVPLEN